MTETGIPYTTQTSGHSWEAHASEQAQRERLDVAADAAITALIRLDNFTSGLVGLARLCTVEELAEMAETAANQLLRRNTAVQHALLRVVTAAKTEDEG